MGPCRIKKRLGKDWGYVGKKKREEGSFSRGLNQKLHGEPAAGEAAGKNRGGKRDLVFLSGS